MESFTKIVNGLKPLTIVAKFSILEVCWSPVYASDNYKTTMIRWLYCDNWTELLHNIDIFIKILQTLQQAFYKTLDRVLQFIQEETE